MTLLLLASLACTKGGGADSGLVDADGDGFTNDVDCDDDDAGVNPDASETCDEVDNDCDDAIDEGTTIDLYPDADGDGYGDMNSPTEGCSQGDGYVVDGDDCDDADADVNPGASEVCNTIDDDCDGDVDDADASLDPASESSFYRDEDGDGYGWEANVTTACEAPSGYTDNAEDCNDALDTVNPDADEVCNGIDDDCDELVDGDDDSIDPSTVNEYYADLDLDGYGDEGNVVTACELEDGLSETGGDCDDSDDSVNPAAEETCNESDANCDGDNWDGATDVWFYADGDGSWTEADLDGWTSTEAGTLYACNGTFTADITLGHDVDIVGLGEDATVLDGASFQTILTIETDSLTVDISGVAFENGTSDYTEGSFGYDAGGALACVSTSAVTISDSALRTNFASLGGVALNDGCTLSFDSVEISGNTGVFGGALFGFSGDIEILDSEVYDNEVTGSGGVFYGYTTGSSNSITFENSSVYSNTATYYGGALMLDVDTEATCIGTSGIDAGFWSNTAGNGYGGGAIRVFDSGASFESDTCDYGTDGDTNNNSPDDIYTDTGTYDTGDTGEWGYDYKKDETFSCDVANGCYE